MWCDVALIAQTRKLPVDAFVKFAKDNHERFRIINEDTGNPRVSSLWIDTLVMAFELTAKVFPNAASASRPL